MLPGNCGEEHTWLLPGNCGGGVQTEYQELEAPLCRGLWEAVAATGARGPGEVTENLLSLLGTSHQVLNWDQAVHAQLTVTQSWLL